MQIARTIAVTACLATMAACSSSGSTHSTAVTTTATVGSTTIADNPAVTRTVTTAPRVATPKPIALWTVHEAGQHYLAMVKPGNKATDYFNKVASASSLTLHKDAARRIAATDGALILQLAHGRWPHVVQTQVKNLTADLLSDRLNYSDMALATTVSEFNTAFNASTAVNNKADTDAGQVRLALGLPLNN